jgi:epoxide hydrolase-like predicted phosphatase
MTGSSGIQAIFWDFGGVIVRTFDRSGRERWEATLGLPTYGLEKLVFRGEMGQKASLGEAQDDDIWRWVGEQLRLDAQQREQLMRDFFRGDRVDHDLMAIIRSQKKKYKTGLISNAWPSLRPAMENEWHIADAFHDLIISAEVGLAKPDPRIYQLALERLEVRPEQAVFIDDFIENVEGAQAVGMHAIQFKSLEQVRADLDATLQVN